MPKKKKPSKKKMRELGSKGGKSILKKRGKKYFSWLAKQSWLKRKIVKTDETNTKETPG